MLATLGLLISRAVPRGCGCRSALLQMHLSCRCLHRSENFAFGHSAEATAEIVPTTHFRSVEEVRSAEDVTSFTHESEAVFKIVLAGCSTIVSLVLLVKARANSTEARKNDLQKAERPQWQICRGHLESSGND